MFFNHQNQKILPILVILSMFILVGCQSLTTRASLAKAEQRGSTVPRNSRETLIFDYFQHLQVQRYEDAYNMRAWHLAPQDITLEYFTDQHLHNHDFLPSIISIGEETKTESKHYTSEPCGYSYEVYEINSDSFILGSGIVVLAPHPKHPETCLIAYNSAFGSVP